MIGRENEDKRKWLYLSAIAILLAGFSCAALVYHRASVDCAMRVQAYESGAGEILPSPDNSKQYLRELELYGGKANVLAYQLRTWFAGLWRGKRLAYLIIFITVVVSSMTILLGRRL